MSHTHTHTHRQKDAQHHSLVTDETQIKTMRYYYTPVRMAKIKSTGQTKIDKNMEKLLVGTEDSTTTLENSWVLFPEAD